jgi:protease I
MRIACVLDNGFEDAEFQDPYKAFGDAGHQVTVIGLEAGRDLKGKRGQVMARSDKGIADVRAEEFDALFIPGGYAPDHLRADSRMVEFARQFAAADRPVFAICHGPQLLLSAGTVEGRQMTAWKTIQEDLKLGGARVIDKEVVVDGNLVTSRQPSDIPAFVRESLAVLERVPASTR